MITKRRHIKLGKLLLLGVFTMTLLTACGNRKKEVEQSIFSERKPFKATFHAANQEKMIGHNENAITLFIECLAFEPNNPAVHFALSDLYEKEGDKEKTLFHAEKAYALNGNNKWYLLRLANLYYERQEYSKTAELYSKIISEEKNIDLKFTYTDALIKSNQFEKAITMLDEIELETGKVPEVVFTKYDLYSQLEKPEAAQAEITAYLEDNPTNSEAKLTVAEFYMQQRKMAEASQLVTEVLIREPLNGTAQLMQADLELRQNNLAGAFSNLENAFANENVTFERKIEIIGGLLPYTQNGQRNHVEMQNGLTKLFDIIYDEDLNNGQLHYFYGTFFAHKNNYENAEKQLQLSCDLDPTSFNAWLQLLDIQKKNDNYAGLFDNGKKAAELYPSQPLFFLFTGIGAKEIKDYTAAEEWLFIGKDLVVKDPPLRSEFLYHLGDMNFRQGNTEEGKFYFEQALQAYPGNVNVYAHNALELLNSNALTEAEAEIKKGISASQNSAKLHHIHGQILFLKKEYKAAGEAFMRALYENYNDGEILERYGDALFLQGQKDKAMESWQEAVKNGNNSEVLKRKIADKMYYESE